MRLSGVLIRPNRNVSALLQTGRPSALLLLTAGRWGYLEEGGALQDAGGAAHLSDGVHGELRASHVHHGDAEPGGQDGSDGGAAGAVVTDHHVLWGGHRSAGRTQRTLKHRKSTVYLQRHRHPAADLPDNRGGDSRGGVALVAVEFDHRTLKEKKIR